MKKLNNKQIRRILRGTIKKIGVKETSTGSSRLVIPFGKDKVVKIALCSAGILQNKNEIELFETYENATDYLATIYAYSDHIIIMERLYDPISLSNGYEIMPDRDFDESIEELNYENSEVVDTIIDELSAIYGYTSDNYQMAYNKDYMVKMYDYGFNTKKDIQLQIGEMSSYSYKYIKDKINNIIRDLS
jgi:hypothetical protein